MVVVPNFMFHLVYGPVSWIIIGYDYVPNFMFHMVCGPAIGIIIAYDMGGCQNYGPFLGPCCNTTPSI